MIKLNKFFIIIFVLSLLFSFIIGGFLPFLIFYTLLSIMLIEYIYMQIIKHTLYVKVIIEQNYYCAGDNVECITQINCDSLLPLPYVEVRSNALKIKNEYVGELVTLTVEENKWISNDVIFFSRGIYDFGRVQLEVADVFHIMSFSAIKDVDVKIKVYPKIYGIQKIFGSGRDIFMESVDKNSSNEDQFTVKDVRKYRNGDSLKKVHWRLSAKYNELYVKNSDTIAGEEIALFIDMNKENYQYDETGMIEESIVDISMSIINQIRQKDISICVLMNNSQLNSFNITNKEEFNSAMEALISINSDGSMPIEDLIQQQCHKMHRMNKIIAVIAKLDQRLVNSFAALRSQGYNISVYYCLSDKDYTYYSELLYHYGISSSSFESLIIDEEDGSRWNLSKKA